MICTSLALAATLALTSPAPSIQGYEKSWIGADARFVVHVDVQAFVGSTLGQELVRMIDNGELDVDDDYHEMKSELGLDPLRDFLSVTVYGKQGDDDAVALIRTTANVEGLLDKLEQEHGFGRVDVDGINLRRWGDGGGDEIYAYVGRKGEGRLFVVADDAQRVTRAVRVIRGDEKNLLQTSNPMITGAPRASTFVYAEAADLEALEELDFDSRTLGNAHGLVVEIGESGGRLFVQASVDTGSGEDASNLAMVIQGAKALIGLAGGEHDIPAAAVDLINSIQVQASGTRLSVSLDTDVRSLLELVREAQGEAHHGHQDRGQQQEREYDEF